MRNFGELPNMFSGDETDLKEFVNRVIDISIKDHKEKNKSKNGNTLVNLCAGECRLFHERMATGIYNNARQTLELFDHEALRKEMAIEDATNDASD